MNTIFWWLLLSVGGYFILGCSEGLLYLGYHCCWGQGCSCILAMLTGGHIVGRDWARPLWFLQKHMGKAVVDIDWSFIYIYIHYSCFLFVCFLAVFVCLLLNCVLPDNIINIIQLSLGNLTFSSENWSFPLLIKSHWLGPDILLVDFLSLMHSTDHWMTFWNTTSS